MSAATQPRRWRRPKVPVSPGDPPTAWLATRFGSVRLTARDGDSIEVRGGILINNAEHDLSALFYRRNARSPFHLGEDHDDPRPAAQRTHQVELSRPYSKPAASSSARGKATVEIDRAVGEWSATRQARSILRAAAKVGARARSMVLRAPDRGRPTTRTQGSQGAPRSRQGAR